MSVVLEKCDYYELGITMTICDVYEWMISLSIGKYVFHIGMFYTGDYDDAIWRT